VWPFYIRENGGRGVVVSPHYSGPAVILDVTLFAQGATPLPLSSLALYLRNTPGESGSNLPLADSASGTPLLEPAGFADDTGGSQAKSQALTLPYPVTTLQTHTLPIRRYVAHGDFYLAAELAVAVGFDNRVWGSVRVLEGVPADLAPNFL
jgi:hypothetical protein